jgi:hypothetical protein
MGCTVAAVVVEMREKFRTAQARGCQIRRHSSKLMSSAETRRLFCGNAVVKDDPVLAEHHSEGAGAEGAGGAPFLVFLVDGSEGLADTTPARQWRVTGLASPGGQPFWV